MKNTRSLIVSLAAVALLFGCGDKSAAGDAAKPAAEAAPATAPAAAKPEAVAAAATTAAAPASGSEALSTDDQKFSYAVGTQVVQSILKQGVKIDADAFALAIRDAVAGNPPRISEEEMKNVVDSRNKTDSDNNATAGKTFREEYAKKEGARVLESGLSYRALAAGSGKTPKADDEVTVKYVGRHIDGKVFDSSDNNGGSVSFKLNQVVKGWQEALTRMKEGDKWEIVIPPELAYGVNGAGGVIGPNETLVFEVELVSIGGAAAAQP